MSPPAPASVAELDDCLTTPDQNVVACVGETSGDVLVLGAGGKMGFHVCRMLQRAFQRAGRSDRIIGVSRFSQAAARRPFEQAGLEWQSADLSDPYQLRVLPDASDVFYLAGIKFGTTARPDLLQQFNVDLPRAVARRFRRSRIVALSTGCVYPFVPPDSGGSLETSSPEAPGAYAQSCLGREQAFTDMSAEWGTRCSLIRLNYSIDLRYGVLVDVAQQVLDGKAIDLQMGFANVIWQRDAVSHVIQSLVHCSAPPFVLNVAGPDTLQIRDLANSFADQFGRDVHFTGHESKTAWLSNAGLAHSMFGIPAMSIPQMIDWTVDWLRRDQPTLGKPTHFQNRGEAY